MTATQQNPLIQTSTALKITPPIHQLPEIGLKLSQSVGNKKTNTSELIPISKTTFLQGVIPFGGSFGYSESKDEQW
jgi:hypothetical protein